tara:strand:+ start:231 stop:419 length:189 start_codon:yes stop_codon:yes gene_type:complete
MNYFILIIVSFFLSCCGYPDIDNVPDFKDVKLTNDEIIDYCSSNYSTKKNIENCIKDYKSNN